MGKKETKMDRKWSKSNTLDVENSNDKYTKKLLPIKLNTWFLFVYFVPPLCRLFFHVFALLLQWEKWVDNWMVNTIWSRFFSLLYCVHFFIHSSPIEVIPFHVSRCVTSNGLAGLNTNTFNNSLFFYPAKAFLWFFLPYSAGCNVLFVTLFFSITSFDMRNLLAFFTIS